MSEPNVFLNGRMVPASQAHLSIVDTGVVLGATVAEMVRTFHKRLYRLDAHLARLARSLRHVGFELGMTIEALAAVAHELVEHNGDLVAPEAELGLVIFVTAGEHAAYGGEGRLGPTVCVHTFPLLLQPWAQTMRRGAHLVTPATRHVPPECIAPEVKCRSRMHYYLAEQEAKRADPEAVPLLLDLAGNVTETSGANVFIVRHGTITSPTPANILPGISRAVAIELAVRLGIPFAERDFPICDVAAAQEGFLTSTRFCIAPATRINGLAIGDGRPGPIYRRLLRAWSEEVGLDIERQILQSASAECGAAEAECCHPYREASGEL